MLLFSPFFLFFFLHYTGTIELLDSLQVISLTFQRMTSLSSLLFVKVRIFHSGGKTVSML